MSISWSEYACPDCRAPAATVDKRVTVLHTMSCSRRPGGLRWRVSLAALQQLVAARTVRRLL